MNTLFSNVRLWVLGITFLFSLGCSSQDQNDAANAPPASEIQQNTETAISQTDTSTTNTSSATTERQPGDPLPTISSASQVDDGYQEIEWDALVPEGYRAENILIKYQDQLAELDDSDPKAMELFGIMQAEMDNAPVNEKLNGKKVKLPGFIAPLESANGEISEFLLVPYFGACIHVPPPPVNQTVLVKTVADNAIDVDKAWEPYWIRGVLTTDRTSTDIGSAGYSIAQATTELY